MGVYEKTSYFKNKIVFKIWLATFVFPNKMAI